jgi:hypothetical protein
LNVTDFNVLALAAASGVKVLRHLLRTLRQCGLELGSVDTHKRFRDLSEHLHGRSSMLRLKFLRLEIISIASQNHLDPSAPSAIFSSTYLVQQSVV